MIGERGGEITSDVPAIHFCELANPAYPSGQHTFLTQPPKAMVST